MARANIVDVLVAIDTVSLLERFPEPSENIDKPTDITKVSGDFVYVLVPGRSAVSPGVPPSAKAHLELARGDIVQWRGVSFARTTENVLIQRFDYTDQTPARPLSSPVFVCRTQFAQYLDPTEEPEEPILLPGPEATKLTVAYWMNVCRRGGSGLLRVTFALVLSGSESTTRVIGYFALDMPIAVAEERLL